MRVLCLQDNIKNVFKVGWFKALDDTGYFEMISSILDGAIQIANTMKVNKYLLIKIIINRTR